jgi:transposase-like protein
MNCPNCGSERVKKHGFNFGVSGAKQRYKCNECGRKFSEMETQESFPAVLVMDIETLPMIGYIWSPWQQDVRKEQLIKDWCILSWAAKWLDDPRMMCDCLTPKEVVSRNDHRIVKSMWALMDDADVIIAQNGKKFDIPKLNTRFWKYQMPQPSSYKVIDTLDAARRAFGVTYNSLDYLGEYLGAGRKLKTEFQLWVDCDGGDRVALGKMREYNERDVTLLEDVYLKMRGWVPNHPKFQIYDKIIGVCPVCLDPNTKEIGLYTASVRQYPEYRCSHCGAIWHDTKAIK